LTDEEVDEDLRWSDGVYAFVPGPVQEDVITQLERIYEKVGFIVYHTYDDAPTALPPNVLAIRPALTADEEARIIQDYRAATVSLGGGN
jgi:hypothetical protein